jgi:hypothetical protein
MARRIATVSGTAIAPGVSRNGRLYSAEAIAKAVARAQTRIDEGARPISMRTHHAGGDDSTRIVGQVTEMTLQPDGSVKYRADIADTEHGRTIADLVDPAGGKPFLRGVSIRGAWLGKVRRQSGPDGGLVETADDLEIAGLDYTAEPGVDVADVADFRRVADGTAETEERVLIYESVQEALVETATTEETTKAGPVTEAADPAKPYGDVVYADPGYQSDKKKRYPLDSKAHAKSAYSYISQADNAKLYTAAQLKRIKGRIKAALKKFGVQVAAENWLIDSADAVTESGPIAEGMYGDSDGSGTFCLNATNGPLSVTLSSYCVDPADMELILHAIVDSAVMALKNVDPDMDGDMDVPGADSEDTDDDMGGESAAGDELTEAEPPAEPSPDTPAEPQVPAGDPEDPAPEAAADQPETEVPAMAEPTTAVEPTQAATPAQVPAVAPTITLSAEQFEQMLARFTAPAPAMAAAEAAPVPAQEATEAAPAAPEPVAETVAETDEDRIARLVSEGIKAGLPLAIQEHVAQNGPPTRKGLVAPVTEHTAPVSDQGLPEGWPQKPLHEYTDEERRQFMAPYTVGAILGARNTQ